MKLGTPSFLRLLATMVPFFCFINYQPLAFPTRKIGGSPVSCSVGRGRGRGECRRWKHVIFLNHGKTMGKCEGNMGNPSEMEVDMGKSANISYK